MNELRRRNGRRAKNGIRVVERESSGDDAGVNVSESKLVLGSEWRRRSRSAQLVLGVWLSSKDIAGTAQTLFCCHSFSAFCSVSRSLKHR